MFLDPKRDKPQFNLVSSSVTANRNGLVAAWLGYVAMAQCSAPLGAWPRGPVGDGAARSLVIVVVLLLQGQFMGRAAPECRWAGEWPCFSLLWPTPCTALAAQAMGMGLSGCFLRFQQSER